MIITLMCMYAVSTLPLSKHLLLYSQPYFLMGLRMTLAGIALLLYCYARKQRFLYDTAHTSAYARVMVFAIFLPYCLRYWALAHHTTPLTSLLYSSGPFITYLCAVYYRVEHINRITIYSLILGLCGLLLYQGLPVSVYLHASYSVAEFALLASVLSFSYGWLCIRHLVVELEQSPLHVNAITMCGGGILGLCASLWCEQAPYMTCMTTALPLLAAVILISNCITHTLYATLLRTYSLTFMQYAGLLVSIYMHITRSCWHGEHVHSMQAAAAVCISVGFFLLYLQERKNAAAIALQRVQHVTLQ